MFDLTMEGILADFTGNVVDCQYNREYDARSVRELVSRTATALADQGVKAGDMLGLSVKNAFSFIVNFFSAVTLKTSLVLLAGGLTEDELARVHRELKLNWVLHDSALPGRPEKNITVLGDYACKLRPVSGNRETQFPAPYIIQPTSGSTGGVKYCVKDGRRVLADAVNYIESIDIKPGVKILNCLPLNHAYGLGFSFLISFLTSGKLFLLDTFHPRKVMTLFRERNIDIFPTIPVHADLLTKIRMPSPSPVPPLIYTAGSILEHKISEKFFACYKTALRPLFGATEVGGISLESEEIVSETGSVGFKLKHTRYELQEDPETGLQTILVDTPSRMLGYWNPGGRIDSSIFRDGHWFPTRDICRQDARGRIKILGRLKNIINVFGFKVDPLEVQNVLKGMPGIRDAHVYAGPHSSGSDLVCAMLALEDRAVGKAQIIDYAKQHLTAKKVPSRVFIVERIPRTSTGKIVKEKLLY